MNTKKACVLYSGGKDSSLIAVILKRMGFEVDLLTANFGVYDSYIPALNSAKSLGFNYDVVKLDLVELEKACDIIINDGFPNNGINYIHKYVIEEIALNYGSKYDVIADGSRRDDRVPKLTKSEIKSLEDRKNIEYINLDGFGYKTINYVAEDLFEIKKEKSKKDNSSDYEIEIRCILEEKGLNPSDIFPEHYQTTVVGWNKNKSKLKIEYETFK
ncbi:MAG: DUF7411 family protein [Methanobacteriaceae archaeon]